MGKKRQPSQKDLDFVRWYTSPASPTYDNATQSAIRAGFSESYAKSNAHKRLVPLAQKMVLDKVTAKTEQVIDKGQFYNELLNDAEKGIAERVRMDTSNDVKQRSIQQKDQHFVAERIGKDKWASKKIVENQGLFVLNDKALETLASVVQGAISAPVEPLHADYTVKSDDLIAEKTKDDGETVE